MGNSVRAMDHRRRRVVPPLDVLGLGTISEEVLEGARAGKETGRMIYRRTPSGHLIEDRENGLFLARTESTMEVRRLIERDNYISESFDGELWTICIGREPNPTFESCNEWGRAPHADDARRYAYAAAIGSYEDPIYQPSNA